MDNGWQNLFRQGVNNTLNSMKSPLDQWLNDHGWIRFLVNHPLVLLALVLLILFLISGVWRALSRASENFWILLLKMPFQILAWFGIRSLSWLRRSKPPTTQERLAQLTQRLETLRQEQDTLIEEMKTLLQQVSPDS